MITGIPGFLLNALSITLMGAVVIILAISLLLTTGVAQNLKLSAQDRRRVFWFLVLSPWLIGVAATAIVVVFSQPEISVLFDNNLVHWHHLDEFYLNSWHGYLVMIMLALAATKLLRVLEKLVRNNTATRLLRDFANPRGDGVLELDSDAFAAFTAGVRNPHCYMTRALISQLSAEEYDVIRLHELTHVNRRDPRQKAWFQILAGFFPAVVSQFLQLQMTMAMEQIADSRVAESISDKAFIARALLKVKRLGGKPLANDSSDFASCFFGSDSIDQRIRYLLSEDETRPLSLVFVFASMAVLAVGCALAADSLHHAIEMSLYHSY